MSSHREAPGVLCDPCADNTDTCAFVTPNNTVAIITNYVPVEAPAGGPNFHELGNDITYHINIDNDDDGRPDIVYQLRFQTAITTGTRPVQHRADRPVGLAGGRDLPHRVHPWHVGGTRTWVAVYPVVVEGTYHLLDDAGRPMAQVAVTGGRVAYVDLR